MTMKTMKKQQEQDKSTSGRARERATFMVAQRAVLYHAPTKTFCIARVAHEETSFNKKYGPWDIFGGHIDRGEDDPRVAIRREIKEESGVDVDELDIVGMQDFSGYGPAHQKDLQRFLVLYYATVASQEITLSDEHQEYLWLTADAIAQHKEVKQWIKDAVVLAQERLREREALAGWQRCVADFDNYKKRQAENARSSMQYAKEDIVASLLPVLDNFHASLDHVPAEHAESPWVTGLGYIQKQLQDILQENGLTEMPVQIGDDFDPVKHEAIKDNADGADASTQEDQDNNDNAQRIAKIVTRGYMMGEKVIRPARVIVR